MAIETKRGRGRPNGAVGLIPHVPLTIRVPVPWPGLLRQIAGRESIDLSAVVRRAILAHYDLAGEAAVAVAARRRTRRQTSEEVAG